MFDFEDWADVLMLVLLWAGFCVALPVAWWAVHSEWVLGQMIKSSEGLMLFSLCFLLALLVSALARRRRQTLRG